MLTYIYICLYLIKGKFEDLVPNEKIVQTWRYKQWPSGHYSKVTMDLIQKVNLLSESTFMCI